MRSARRLFRFHLALGVAGAMVVAYGAAGVLRATTTAPPAARELLHACSAMTFDWVTPGSLAVLVLATLSATSALRGATSAVRRVRAHRRVVRALPPSAPVVVNGTTIRLFAGDRPEAFCAGLACPRVFISTAAARRLSPDELDAVVAHEAHHAQRREPLRLLLIGVLCDALFFLPALRDAQRRYAALAEVAADEAAVRRTGAEPLASALLRIGSREGIVGIAAERVDHLLGRPAQWRLRASLIAGGAVVLAGIAALSASAPAAAVNAPLLAMELCHVSMVAMPVLAGGWMLVAAWRAVARRSG